MSADEFVRYFNDYYPFERYIFKTPATINYLFDDIQITEIFIPSTEIKPIFHEGQFVGHTEINTDEIYIKFRTKNSHSQYRLAYYDFAEHIREEIEYKFIADFGSYAWDCLYIEFDDEDLSELKEALQIQKDKITRFYGECNVKSNFNMTDTINIIKQLC